LRTEATDDDSNLIALGKQLKETVIKIQRLCHPASADSHLELIESTLVCLEPIEQDAPIDQIDWDARAVRSLIEAVCDLASI
jgi:hypothetical protein